MGDGEASALGAGLAVVKIPLGGASFGLRTNMPSQLSTSSTIGALISGRPCRRRARQHLPDDLQIDGVGHAVLYHARNHFWTVLAAMDQ